MDTQAKEDAELENQMQSISEFKDTYHVLIKMMDDGRRKKIGTPMEQRPRRGSTWNLF